MEDTRKDPPSVKAMPSLKTKASHSYIFGAQEFLETAFLDHIFGLGSDTVVYHMIWHEHTLKSVIFWKPAAVCWYGAMPPHEQIAATMQMHHCFSRLFTWWLQQISVRQRQTSHQKVSFSHHLLNFHQISTLYVCIIIWILHQTLISRNCKNLM